MSCNGCRVLRKGCSEACILRPCLQWMDTPQSQAYATLFVAKFFGRAGLISFISNVPLSHRPALFQSLLYEACARTVNPVTGAVGLLWTGNWHVCQAAVDTVLRGGSLRPIPDFHTGVPPSLPNAAADADDISEVVCPKHIIPALMVQDLNSHTSNYNSPSPPRFTNSQVDLILTPPSFSHAPPPSLNSEESATTISLESGGFDHYHHHLVHGNAADEPRMLNLFV